MEIIAIMGGPLAGKSTAAGYIEQRGWQLFEPHRIIDVLAQQIFRLEPFQLQGAGLKIPDPSWDGLTGEELREEVRSAILSTEFGHSLIVRRALSNARRQGCKRVVLDGVTLEDLHILLSRQDDRVWPVLVTRKGAENLELQSGWLQISNPVPPLSPDASWYQPFLAEVTLVVNSIEQAIKQSEEQGEEE